MVGSVVNEELLTAKEVGKLFRVDPKTVARWVKAGQLTELRTPGGHLRFRKSEVIQLIEGRNNAVSDSARQRRDVDR